MQERKQHPEWDPKVPGVRVRLHDNPAVQGFTTGRTREVGSVLLVQIEYGPNEKPYKPYLLLELVDADEDIFDLLSGGKFGGPVDLRRVLTFEKIKGSLTNVFYSMEASNTDFYPHQFKPVLRFIESPLGRMLIADEVGLGKTIEAIYIWKEMQARQSARRLLIVCPAMLREKWRSDLRKKFNIAAQIVSAKDMLPGLEELARYRASDAFIYITSLEGLRAPANYDDESKKGTNARFARLLDENQASDDFALFDQVIIDEAHYLRNPSTGNHRIGRLLRDASRNLLLLTATPIQIDSDNLYQLLRLVDPDQFEDSFQFRDTLNANASIVRAQRALWSLPPDFAAASRALEVAERSEYFKNDAVLNRIRERLVDGADDPDRRIDILRLLESRSLLSQYMTRSRKREVLEQRVERTPQVLSVHFSDAESEIYQHVTARIREQAIGKAGISLFSLIARQRQMASSIVGALESWRDKGLLEELLWEDFGISPRLTDLSDEENDLEGDDGLISSSFGYDLHQLEMNDTKYQALKEFLSVQLDKHSSEKFVVFAFYRGTLKYLARRLLSDGFRVGLIMGDMREEKDGVIQTFSRSDGPSVLLSSEVGSEGIDLQFCRFLVNYDLPWNPMKIEQRIGRLDRLGQKAKRISIINMVVDSTIEDRILLRLYSRLDVFRESIGDLEGILGEVTERLMIDLLDPQLTDEERERRALQDELALSNRRQLQTKLEEEAVNLVGFSDYILDNIRDSRDKGRWLSAGELRSLTEDFFARNYPGTKIEPVGDDKTLVLLSEEARGKLASFIAEKQPSSQTRLHRSSRPVSCVFDPRRATSGETDVEFIEPAHPLVQWIRASYDGNHTQLHRASALTVSSAQVAIAPGDYAFCVHRWSFKGLRTEELLSFRSVRITDGRELDGSESETFINMASRIGEPIANAANVLGELDRLLVSTQRCDEILGDAYAERLSDFESENRVRCDQQATSAEKLASRRLESLGARITKFRAEGKTRPIAMTEGLIRREQEQLEAKLARVTERRNVDPILDPLCAGFIRVLP